MANERPRKAVLWDYLKAAEDRGVPLELNRSAYIRYSESDFEAMLEAHGLDDPTRPVPSAAEGFEWDPTSDWQGGGAAPAPATPAPERPGAPASRPVAAPVSQGVGAARRPVSGPRAMPLAGVTPEQQASHLEVPLRDLPEDRAGLHFNDPHPDAALRVDSTGRVWYQDEVMKPAIPKPRMRREVQYIDPGVTVHETRRPDGGLNETFEVAGEENRVMTTKTTLPSWQVGIYWDQRFPFKVHTYNGLRGFDRMDVVNFYGGADLVPASIEKTYVGQSLCYDIRTTRMAMEQEYRDMVLRERN